MPVKMEQLCRKIFESGYKAVLPSHLIQKVLKYESESRHLIINNEKYPVKGNVYVVGFGKAVSGMIKATEHTLQGTVVSGIGSIPIGAIQSLKAANLWSEVPTSESKVEFIEGAKDNIPDELAASAANKIEALASKLTELDILLVLISGGGSALLPAPVEGITLNEKSETVKTLSKAGIAPGASIDQLNTVRQHLSRLKGGRLAEIAQPAQVISLIFSDVIGNDLEFVASGPTVPCTTTKSDALKIIKDLNAVHCLPKSVIEYLSSGTTNTSFISSSFSPALKVKNVLIGENSVALNAVKKALQDNGCIPLLMQNNLSGEASEVGKIFAKLTVDLLNGISWEKLTQKYSEYLTTENGSIDTSCKKPIYLIWGGETTVVVKNLSGKGGRNQEMVLAYFTEIYEQSSRINLQQNNKKFVFLSCGTDGQDGPTDAAGAICSSDALSQFKDWINTAQECLERNNSYNFFQKFCDGQYHVISGITGTNVMDIQLLCIYSQS